MFRERKKAEREREREKYGCKRETWIGCSHTHPDWGSNQQPSYVPYLGIEPANFWCTGKKISYGKNAQHVISHLNRFYVCCSGLSTFTLVCNQSPELVSSVKQKLCTHWTGTPHPPPPSPWKRPLRFLSPWNHTVFVFCDGLFHLAQCPQGSGMS